MLPIFISFGLYSHLQDKSVAAGGFIRVNQADYVGVLESLKQIEFLSHPVPPHQLLVHVFDRHCTFGPPLVTTLDDRETTPGGNREDGRSEVSLLTSDTCFLLLDQCKIVSTFT